MSAAFGAPPDIVLSGINHGVNVGRSAMHSGTVGAALDGGRTSACAAWRSRSNSATSPSRGVRLRSSPRSLIPVLGSAPRGTTLNLNVPDVELAELRGLRAGRLGRGGTIRSAVHDTGGGTLPHVTLPPFPSGTLRLDLTPPGTNPTVDPDTDAGLLAHGFASLTALVGVRDAANEFEPTLLAAMDALYEVPGIGRGTEIGTDEAEEDLATG